MAFSGSESEYELEEILDSRKRGRATEYKVRWKTFGEEEDSWEPERSLMKTAPKAVEEYKKRGSTAKKTPTRAKQLKQEQNDSIVVTQRSSGRISRSNTSTTSTTTKSSTVTKLESFSDASDTEGGLLKRSTRTVTQTTTSSGGSGRASSSIANSGSSSISNSSSSGGEKSPSMLARYRNCRVPSRSICKDLPFAIFMACMLFIAASFAYQR